MPKLTINGHAVEVPPGTNLIEAARRVGVEIPHYCYHPGLSIAGQCRLCMVDIEKTPRPTIACNTLAAEGMVVATETDRVKETRKSIMEFHLINHPLDCPVCDQAGECWLQIYYMEHGLYDPRMRDEKVHKPKAVPLGPHVMLDAERCILCSRCVRFCDEVTRTGELGIFDRGDHSEIGLFPGTELANKYSGNVVDICAVGDATWEEAIGAVAGALRRFAPDEIGVFASPKMANEDLWALRRVLEAPGIRRVAFRVPPREPGDADTLLIRSDKNPNSHGAALLGLDGDGAAILAAARARQVKCLWVFGHDLLAGAWPEAETDAALRALPLLIFTGTNANATSERAHWVLPAAAWVEREGTYTNFEGRVQRFRQAVEPLGQALSEWDILGRVLRALGVEVGATRAERWFRELAAAVPAFAGLTYQAIGDTGAVLSAPTAGHPRSEPASRTTLQ